MQHIQKLSPQNSRLIQKTYTRITHRFNGHFPGKAGYSRFPLDFQTPSIPIQVILMGWAKTLYIPLDAIPPSPPRTSTAMDPLNQHLHTWLEPVWTWRHNAYKENVYKSVQWEKNKDNNFPQSPVLLTLDLFQEIEQCSTQAVDDRHRATGLCEVESEHALETACAPLSTAVQSR